MTVITLPMPPTTNNLFAGNGRRRYRTSQYNTWAEAAGWELKRQRPASVAGRVSLLIQVAEPKTKRAQDLDNKTKALLDLLVFHGVIQGDSQNFVRRIILEWADIDGIRITVEGI